MRNQLLPFLALSLVIAAPAGAQSVKAGVDAWRSGDAAGAVAIWKPLAAKGNADAAFNLGQAYRLGKGVPINLGEAQRWLEVAARKGHIDAQTTLGLMLFSSGNRAGGIRWLQSAANAGEPRAMLMYGTALYNGDGVKENPVQAYAYVSRAAAAGLAPAKSTLADMDQVMPAEQRKQGLAVAQAMTGKAKAPAAKPAPVATPPRAVATAKPASKPAPPAVTASGGWRIQLGAFSQRSGAEALFAKVEPKLGGRQAYFVPVGNVVRLQAGPYANKAAAASACAALKPTPCFPVPGR